MSGDDGVSRRSLLLGLGSAGAIGFASGTGTRAMLSDSETFTDNRFRAGTIDLELATTWFRGRWKQCETWDEAAEEWRPADWGDRVEFAETDFASARTVSPVVDGMHEGEAGAALTAFRVCDNPATVSVRLDGTVDDGDSSVHGDLADRIEVVLFSADSLGRVGDCLDPDDEDPNLTLLDAGSLRELLGRSYDLGPGATRQSASTDGDPVALGKLEFDENEGDDLVILLEDTAQAWSGTIPAGAEEFVPNGATFDFDGPDGTVTVELTRFYVKDADGDDREVYAFDYETNAGSVCRVEVKGGSAGGGGNSGRGNGNGGSGNGNNGRAPGPGGSGGVRIYTRPELGPSGGTELRPPENDGGNQAAVSNVVFYTCPGDDPDSEPPECLPACEPAYLGLAWVFPWDFRRDNSGWLGDRVDFSLTFDAEQCRHRDEAGHEGGESA